MSTRSAKPVPGVYEIDVDDGAKFVGNSEDMARRMLQHAAAGLISDQYAEASIRSIGRRRFFRRR